LAVAGLAQHAAAERAQGLLRERGRLLREAQKKQRQLDEVRQRADRDAQEAVGKMAPLLERNAQLVRNLSALFEELLARPKLSARARRLVLGIRGSLQLQGVLPGRADELELEEQEPWHDPTATRRPHRDTARASRAPEVAGARQVGQERRSLRELFRSLARAIHPDQARHEAERARRTEVMKEVTRAYEDGDLARLVELERTWQGEQTVVESADSLTRCRELERLNHELLKQVRELTRRLRDAKQEAREASYGLPADELLEQASRELDGLEIVHDFLCRFRDGKLSLSELSQGPHAAGFATPAPSRRRARAAGRRPS
jgi:hypothetical protein